MNNLPALVQIMAWCRSGDKPLSEPMMVILPTHICVTRPQCVKPKQYNLGTKSHMEDISTVYHQTMFQTLFKSPDSKVYGANMVPTWGRQDPGGHHVGPMNVVIWVTEVVRFCHLNISLTINPLMWSDGYQASRASIHTQNVARRFRDPYSFIHRCPDYVVETFCDSWTCVRIKAF